MTSRLEAFSSESRLAVRNEFRCARTLFGHCVAVRGRDLAEILEDNYVQNRLTPQQRARLLDRPEVIKALGNETVQAAKTSLET